jgi:hypothetical protein
VGGLIDKVLRSRQAGTYGPEFAGYFRLAHCDCLVNFSRFSLSFHTKNDKTICGGMEVSELGLVAVELSRQKIIISYDSMDSAVFPPLSSHSRATSAPQSCPLLLMVTINNSKWLASDYLLTAKQY